MHLHISSDQQLCHIINDKVVDHLKYEGALKNM